MMSLVLRAGSVYSGTTASPTSATPGIALAPRRPDPDRASIERVHHPRDRLKLAFTPSCAPYEHTSGSTTNQRGCAAIHATTGAVIVTSDACGTATPDDVTSTVIYQLELAPAGYADGDP